MRQPKGPEAREKKHPMLQDFFQKQQASEQLKRISAAAETAQISIKTLKEAQKNTDIKGLQDKLKAALCGQDVDASTSPFTCKHSSSDAFSKTTSCTANKAGKSIANDIACVCTHNADAFCVSTLGADKLSSNALAENAMEAILAAGPQLPEHPKNLADAIQSSTQTIAGLLAEAHQAGKVFLGKDADGACTANMDSCVAYEAYYGTNNLGFESIPLVKALRQAQQHYRDYLGRENTKDLAAAKVAQMRVAAEAAYSAANIALPLQKQIAGQQDTGTPEFTKQTKCTKKNTTPAACRSTDCDYDREKEEWTPKLGTESTAAGTEDGIAGVVASTGCTRHGTDKTACENDKTGDKQNCAWRKGKDGEYDREKRRQRNYEMIVFLSLRKFLLWLLLL
uniref:Variant surface glycoprotein 1125.5065 n=1 Tax=Trypanosoma brucei TaxID=5691 RepID=A0A1J0RBN9_9TRYP|nr:variant surface glycoprotein 1125.5065 [Trypanosoma brucei]